MSNKMRSLLDKVHSARVLSEEVSNPNIDKKLLLQQLQYIHDEYFKKKDYTSATQVTLAMDVVNDFYGELGECVRNLVDVDKNFKQVVYESENYNKIIEELPIKVNVKKSWSGSYYTINVPPMKMKYETFLKLGANLSDEEIKYGKGKDGRKYSKDIEALSNDVSISDYNYKNGEANFNASTENDIRNWLELYKEYVYSDNF